MRFSSVPAYSFNKSKSQAQVKQKFNQHPGPADYQVNWKKDSSKKKGPSTLFSKADLHPRSAVKRKKQNYEELLQIEEASYDHRRLKKKRKRGLKLYLHIDKAVEDSVSESNREKLEFSMRRDSYYKFKRGPGSYDINASTLSKKGSSVIARGPKEDIGLKKWKKRIPGPGSYLGQQSTLERKGFARETSKADRHGYIKRDLSIPGPGDYKVNKSSFSKKGVARIGRALSRQSLDDITTPGPGDYDVRTTKRSRGIPIPKVGRNRKIDRTPGPGHYNLNNTKKMWRGGVKIFRARKKSGLKRNNPGPGHYLGQVSSFSRKGSAVINDIKRFSTIDKTPGPGDYQNLKVKLKGVIFEKQKRWFRERKNKPGPGSYEYKPSFPDVASYNRLPKLPS